MFEESEFERLGELLERLAGITIRIEEEVKSLTWRVETLEKTIAYMRGEDILR